MSASVSCLLMTFWKLAANAEADVAEHLAAELQGHERRAEAAGGAGLELGNRVHHLRDELGALGDGGRSPAPR